MRGPFSEEDKLNRIYEIAGALDTREKERFEFFNACQPIRIVVQGLDNDGAQKIGLTEDRVQRVAESRLRSARLYSEEGNTVLHLKVNVVGHAFSNSLEFKKRVSDQHEHSGSAVTWDVSSAGTHGGDPSFIVSGLSEKMDKFLVEYLRVNETGCEKR